jgi:beta-lactam-binding protein with PASTA domain
MNIKSILLNIYARNLLLAVFILCILTYITLKWLSDYTKHGESVEIPDVKGMTITVAEPFFSQKNISYQVIDSAFYNDFPPGSIIETIPPVGSKIKKGRTIYLRINSYGSQTIDLPEVRDLSQRQASAMLRSLGFENVKIRMVPGAFRDLVLGLESSGREMNAGDKVFATMPLTLLVSSGNGETDISGMLEDTVVVSDEDEDPDETWF